MSTDAAANSSFSETFRFPYAPNLLQFPVEQRKWFTQAAMAADAALQQQYRISLDQLRPGDLLLEEFQYVSACRSQPASGTSPKDEDTCSVSTTTTDMALDMGTAQLLHHQKRLIRDFHLRNATPTMGPFPSRTRGDTDGPNVAPTTHRRPAPPDAMPVPLSHAHTAFSDVTTEPADIYSPPRTPATHHVPDPTAFSMPSPRLEFLRKELNSNLAQYQSHCEAIIKLEIRIHQIEADMLHQAD